MSIKNYVEELEEETQCTCDLDNWEPEKSTGHSKVCKIHKAAMKRLREDRVPSMSPGLKAYLKSRNIKV